MGTITASKRQLAWVFDLNKCIGCQTCSVACKVLWPNEDKGTEAMWWMTVNTQPGQGTPRGWEEMGGGYQDGKLELGRAATDEETGGGWDFNYDEVLRGGHGRSTHLKKISGSKTWGM
jgi:nitrate reductase beta subunit